MAHGHPHAHEHAHVHGAVDAAVLRSAAGLRAVKLSLAVLAVTASAQLAVVLASGSVSLLADTIHNGADALTALPLWVAFRWAARKPTPRFTYGYGRFEDFAGLLVLALILLSGVLAVEQSVQRFLHPQPVRYLEAVAAAAIAGFLGNEACARIRLRAGEAIGSAALVADGHHARLDGLTSLAVLVGAAGIALGVPAADPAVGLAIAVLIFKTLVDAGRPVVLRLLDGVDPEVVDEVRAAALAAPRVAGVTEVRVRWLGHRLRAELNVTVPAGLSVEEGHETARDVRHRLLHELRYLDDATVHVDPATAPGAGHHGVAAHAHDGLPPHAH